jgi:hypothetical protein
MAGEVEETLIESQSVPVDALPNPEDEEFLGAIVSKAQHPVFTGHPAMGEAEGEGEETRKAEGEGEGEGEGKADEVIPEGWEFKPKYKDHQEAEKGAKEHQALATRKAEEAKEQREAREAAEWERDELRQKLAEKEAVVAEPAKTLEELEAAQESKIEQALEEIDKIDEFDPDYKNKVAKAWRKAGIGGSGQAEIAKLVQEQIKVEREAETRAKVANEETNVRTRAGELAGKAGLSMEEGTADNILFWATVGKMPKEFDDKPFGEQVQWTVNEVRRLKGEVVQSKAEMEARARKTQTDNVVLGRGAERPKQPAAPESYTLGSILDKHQAGRRI